MNKLNIRWYGHSCFRLESAGVRVLTDPCDPGTGYALSGIEADVVTVSHGHHDHNYVAALAGEPAVVEGVGRHEAAGVAITGYPSFHDPEQGRLRGCNTMFLIELGGFRILHAGDLGAMPDEATLTALGAIDVLLTPVGGRFTVDAAEAATFVRRVNPGLTIPMHYATPALTFALAGVEPFLRLLGDQPARHADAETVLTRAELTNGVLVFDRCWAVL